MKKTIIKICVIFFVLFCYCSIESLYLDMFADTMVKRISDFKNGAQDKNNDYLFLEMLSYYNKNEGLLSFMISGNDVEKIRLNIEKIEDQMNFEKFTAAKVTAGELACMLSEIKK